MKRIPKYVIPLAFSALATINSSSYAVNDMFLKLDGIPGESQNTDHKDEIDVLAWSWSLNAPYSLQGGAGAPLVRPLTISKYIDASSAALYTKLIKGERIKEGILTVRKAGGTNPVDYIVITMQDVVVSSTSPGGSGEDDRHRESISLNFSSVCIKYTSQRPDGSALDEYNTCWDITAK